MPDFVTDRDTGDATTMDPIIEQGERIKDALSEIAATWRKIEHLEKNARRRRRYRERKAASGFSKPRRP